MSSNPIPITTGRLLSARPTDLPGASRRPVLVALPPARPSTLPLGAALVDCDGNKWRVTGRTAGGDVRLACDLPRDPDDCGEGPSWPWTLATAEAWFGPLRPVQGVAA